MKEIQLSKQGKNKDKFIALVDDEDYDYLNQWRWSVVERHRTCYAMRIEVTEGGRTTFFMHRFIMNTPRDIQVDHIDGNGLNNQKSNLRNATHGQNQSNRKSWGRSVYLGVSFQKGGYLSTIRSNNKQIYLGLFTSEEEAAIAYDKAALALHGEFSRLNFPLNNSQ